MGFSINFHELINLEILKAGELMRLAVQYMKVKRHQAPFVEQVRGWLFRCTEVALDVEIESL
jgi:hypothetical protein